jgi:hypothetical protein
VRFAQDGLDGGVVELYETGMGQLKAADGRPRLMTWLLLGKKVSTFGDNSMDRKTGKWYHMTYACESRQENGNSRLGELKCWDMR